MNAFNRISSAIFDLILDLPPGDQHAWFDLIVWPVLGGIVALLVYKYTSNQRGITHAKSQIKMRLVEIRLFSHDIAMVVQATGHILFNNGKYLGLNIVPMLVMIVPIMSMLVQLEARYAFDPMPVGQEELLELELDSDHCDVPVTAVRLELPAGVSQVAPPVRTPDGQIYWSLRADAPGDHVLNIHVGDTVVEKGLAVGGIPRKVPVMRTKSLDALLYPGEGGLPGDSPVYDVRIRYPERELAYLPDGELGILIFFFVLSLVSGYALKDVFGVVL
jgi:hypothetical protein